MRKRLSPEEQPSLFAPAPCPEVVRQRRPPAAERVTERKWRMPAVAGRTVAEIRVRWQKRLTPAQVARVEAELSALPKHLSKLGFGAVQVERVFVRRRKT